MRTTISSARHRVRWCRALTLTVAAGICTSAGASAQELVYEPVNPSFGGNSFNSAHLLAIANAQNDFERPETESSTSSDLDRFIRSLQSRLLSSLSTQVANAIFGENAQDSGTIRFGDQTVSFVRTLDGIELTITDADGTVTVITVPTFESTDSSSTSLGGETASGKNNSSSNKPSAQIVQEDGGLTYQPSLSESALQPIQQSIQ